MNGWIRITDPNELLELSKQLKLTPKTFSQTKPLLYCGIYVEKPVFCELVGYIDRSFVVIDVAGDLHTIHTDYLLEMQSDPEVRAMRDAFNASKSESDDTDPYEVPTFTDNDSFSVYTVVDLETTGLSKADEIMEIAALRVENGTVTAQFSKLVQPTVPVSISAAELTGITDELLDGCPCFCDILPEFLSFIGDTPLVGHNFGDFDYPRLLSACTDTGYQIDNLYCDTLTLAKRCLKLPSYKLQCVAQALNVTPGQAHRALGDCQTTFACFEKLHAMSPDAVELLYPPQALEPTPARSQPRITREQFNHFRTRPKAKDIIPTTDLFDPSHPLYDQTCVITGKLETIPELDAMQSIANCGGHNADNVTKKIDILIVGQSSAEQKSGKVKKAEEYITKGIPIRIITEDQFVDMLHGHEGAPTASARDSDTSDTAAARIMQEMITALADAQEKYDLDKVQLQWRTPEKAAPYHAIELFGQSCMNFKGVKTLYLEVCPKLETLLTNAGFSLETDRANGWARIPADDFSFAGHTQLVIEVYEKYLMANGFDCCSRYLECSEAERCMHPDIMFAGQCTYRQKLRSGRIFYGSKRTI